ncbi:unnamed protein product [Penicillium salamii]|uniref:F-box domain-containing protein n=1 Tax=Penicillium salamii TaxID=1612424 RepID=A0A9W4INW0_9EURO|nr:unnamed protein product [Penicillium salamii]CAG8120206.1 unnamed protein product [Penicillium salamii]CAG8291814.1 unnamed protein product [Penicillium salamii]CAG8343766.1 unnamed protein product [Penicillium salamii]CAG8345612.1 unnamed protein product [Penicillium salamii]
MATHTFTVPAEIWHVIFSFLSSSDLQAASLVNRDLRIMAEPFLYACIKWTWTASQTPPITQFLQFIVQRPEVASFVHELIISGDHFDCEWHDYKYQSQKLQVSEDVTNQLVRYVESIDVPYTKDWIQELHAGSMDAFTALLLSQLPNLNYLHLSENFVRESRWIGMILRSSLCESQNNHISSFAHLREVLVQCPCQGFNIREHTDTKNTESLLPLFYFSSIERLSLSIDNPTTFTWTGRCPPNQSRLTSLDLSMMREGHLGQLLSVTQGLRKLKWFWAYHPEIKDKFVTDIIDLDLIIMDLSHIQETLTDLTIGARASEWPGDLWPSTLYLNGSFNLSGFHALERIKIPIPFMLGFSPTSSMINLEKYLPKSLEWLTITDDLCFQEEWEWEYDKTHLVGAVRSWLQDWRRFTPRLRGFCLSGEVQRLEDWQPEMIDGLKELALEFGVHIQVTGKGITNVFG